MMRTTNSKSNIRPESRTDIARIPSVAGRLREANWALRSQMLEHVHRAGFADVSYPEITIFRYEGPDGRRPTAIATSAQLSKQMVNDLLRRLEQGGYLQRKPHPQDGRGRIVYLTARGRQLDAAVWDAGRSVERTWRQRIGEPDWHIFQRVLEQLSHDDDEDARDNG